jgi:hypothetical protein
MSGIVGIFSHVPCCFPLTSVVAGEQPRPHHRLFSSPSSPRSLPPPACLSGTLPVRDSGWPIHVNSSLTNWRALVSLSPTACPTTLRAFPLHPRHCNTTCHAARRHRASTNSRCEVFSSHAAAKAANRPSLAPPHSPHSQAATPP